MENILCSAGTIWLLVLCFVIPFVLTAFNIYNSISKKKINEMYIDLWIIFLGTILTLYLLSIEEADFISSYIFTSAFIGFIGIIKLVADDIYSFFNTVVYISFISVGIFISVVYSAFVVVNIENAVADMYLCLFPLNYILCGIRNIKKYIGMSQRYCDIPKNKNIMKLQKLFAEKQKATLFTAFLSMAVAVVPLLAFLGEKAIIIADKAFFFYNSFRK